MNKKEFKTFEGTNIIIDDRQRKKFLKKASKEAYKAMRKHQCKLIKIYGIFEYIKLSITNPHLLDQYSYEKWNPVSNDKSHFQ